MQISWSVTWDLFSVGENNHNNEKNHNNNLEIKADVCIIMSVRST